LHIFNDLHAQNINVRCMQFRFDTALTASAFVSHKHMSRLCKAGSYSRAAQVVFAIIIGGFSLGQAAPNFPALSLGRSAGYRIYKLIDRVPAIDAHALGDVPQAPLRVRCSGQGATQPARLAAASERSCCAPGPTKV
jgi:hypothetical protein